MGSEAKWETMIINKRPEASKKRGPCESKYGSL
jgi:hypothetical protein